MPSEIFGVAPWVIIAGVIAWFSSYFVHREKKIENEQNQGNQLVIHRDELTLAIIRTGREEISVARLEVEDLRDEVKKLRAMENHFYHFQQSLDHLEALLLATTPEENDIAERAARAFLNRMRRLQEAKGTVANEVQRTVSKSALDTKDK